MRTGSRGDSGMGDSLEKRLVRHIQDILELRKFLFLTLVT